MLSKRNGRDGTRSSKKDGSKESQRFVLFYLSILSPPHSRSISPLRIVPVCDGTNLDQRTLRSGIGLKMTKTTMMMATMKALKTTLTTTTRTMTATMTTTAMTSVEMMVTRGEASMMLTPTKSTTITAGISPTEREARQDDQVSSLALTERFSLPTEGSVTLKGR